MSKPFFKSLPSDFVNPFKGRNPEQVWKELQPNARPVSKEEMTEIKKKANRLQKGDMGN